MAKRFLTHIDMSGNQIVNAAFEKLTADPNSGNFEGRIYFNTVDNLLKVYDGSQWVSVGSVLDVVAGTDIDVSASNGVYTVSLESEIASNTSGNAATATALQTARTISLGGDLSGSALFDGTSDITITASVDSNAGVDSIGNSDGNIEVSASVGSVSINLASTIDADTTGNAATASQLANARTIALGGDLSGSASFDGSASITITADIQPDSVALGTDTTGDYVASVSASDGISATGTGEGASVSLTNTDKGSSQNIFKTISGDTGAITANSNSASVTVAGGTGITTSASAGTVTIDNNGVLSVSGTANQISASTVSGAVTLSLPNAVTFPGTVTLNADPQNALEAATKQYVDSVAEGLNVHASVYVATTASVDLSNPPAAIDGVTLTDGMRVLVKNQSTASQNGIYVYDLANTDLVRATDYNEASEIDPGDFFFVTAGNTYADTGWVQTATVTTLGTDPVTFTQFSGAGTYLAGNGLELNGNTFSIDTDVTVDLSTAQTLTNKTLTSPTISGLYLSDNNIVIEGTNDVHETTLNFTDPTQDNTITFKDATGTVAFTSDIPSNTDGLTEGTTNLYFTNERAEDAIGAILVDTATVDLIYTDNGASAGTISADVILKASNSYLASASGLAVDIAAVETKLVADSFTKKATANIGNAVNTSFAISHNFNTRDVVVNVYDNTTYDTVEVDITRTDADTVTVSFASAPGTNAYRVVVIG
jgi:hypothetical protein